MTAHAEVHSGGMLMRVGAVVRYELLWNLRKKKFLAMLLAALGLSILLLALTPILSNYVGEPVAANPDHVINSANLSLFFFFFALVTVMNSISGEFESGSIVPLLTKPVSRTEVFLAKLSAALITLVPVYTVLILVDVVGGTMIYGPQERLYLTPVLLAGALMSTAVWVSIVLAIGSVTRSSLIAALGAFVVYIALNIVSPVVSLFFGQSWVLSLLPGSGQSGYIAGAGAGNPLVSGLPVSTGTDSLGALIVQYIIHPSSAVTFYKIGNITPGGIPTTVELYSSPLLNVSLEALGIAALYAALFCAIAWFALKRAQISE